MTEDPRRKSLFYKAFVDSGLAMTMDTTADGCAAREFSNTPWPINPPGAVWDDPIYRRARFSGDTYFGLTDEECHAFNEIFAHPDTLSDASEDSSEVTDVD